MTKECVDIAHSVTAKILTAGGNEPDDVMLTFTTSSGDNTVPVIGEAARRVSRLMKTDAPRAFCELLGLVEGVSASTPVFFDNCLDEEFVGKTIRDLAAACRAVFRAEPAAMKQDETNVNVLKLMVRALLADAPDDVGGGAFGKAKFGAELPKANKKS